MLSVHYNDLILTHKVNFNSKRIIEEYTVQIKVWKDDAVHLSSNNEEIISCVQLSECVYLLMRAHDHTWMNLNY